MTPKQQKFIDIYIETGDVGTAYKEAGFKSKNRNSQDAGGSRLLRTVRSQVDARIQEIADAGKIRIESKRLFLWEIAQKASGRLAPNGTNEPFKPDYKAAVAALNELNRMDGHHKDPKLTLKPTGITFDAEILPPEEAEIVHENE